MGMKWICFTGFLPFSSIYSSASDSLTTSENGDAKWSLKRKSAFFALTKHATGGCLHTHSLTYCMLMPALCTVVCTQYIRLYTALEAEREADTESAPTLVDGLAWYGGGGGEPPERRSHAQRKGEAKSLFRWWLLVQPGTFFAFAFAVASFFEQQRAKEEEECMSSIHPAEKERRW